MHSHTTHTCSVFNAVVNNCHPNGVSLERPPMCKVLSLWIITDLLSGPLMWEMYLISICFPVYAVSVHWLIHFIRRPENPEPFISSSWKLGSETSQSSFSHYAEEQHDSFHWTLYSSPCCFQPLMPRAHIPPRPHLKGLSCVILQRSKCCILPCLSLQSSLSRPITFKSNKPVFWARPLAQLTSLTACFHFSRLKVECCAPAIMSLTFSQGSRLKLAPKVF